MGTHRKYKYYAQLLNFGPFHGSSVFSTSIRKGQFKGTRKMYRQCQSILPIVNSTMLASMIISEN